MNFKEETKYKDRIGIYQIKNIINGKLYIGQTKDRFIERYWNHTWKLRNGTHENKHLQKSFIKYGEDNFEFSVLHILNDFENIDDLEIYYISLYDFNKLYNSIGSDGRS